VTPAAPRLGFVLRVVVTAAVLWLVFRAVDWPALAGLAEKIQWPLFLLAAACMGLAYPLHAVRLGVLLRQQQITVPFPELHRITWISVFFGSFTPGGVGGDVSRLVHMYGRVPDNKPGGTAAVLADRVIGLIVLLLLAAIAACDYQAGTEHPSPQIVALGVIFVSALVALVAGWWLLARLAPGGRFAAVSAAARQTLRPPAPLALAALISLGIWSVDFFAGWLLARALGWPIGLMEISLALAVAYTAASLPLSLGGHGVREGALVVVIGWFGFYDHAPLLAVAFLALTLFWCLVGGAVWLLAPPTAQPAH
jgi:uncharacterized membrane protein YbhN (UPF0104 family)